MQILILGANGLIGSAVTQTLVARGHSVTAMARNASVASRRMPQATWVEADLSKLTAPQDWQPWLSGFDAVVNCAGALQDGPRDDVDAVQNKAMQALYSAAPRKTLIVQISARTDAAAAGSAFMSTKRRADEALAASGLPYVIFRPAIVVGRHAYGGTALVRALAAFPFCTPLANSDSILQFAALDDVADAVADAIAGDIAVGSDIHIAGAEKLSLAQAVTRHRQWLGLAPVRAIPIPTWTTRIVAAFADAIGRLGWRSPLRSTALDAAAGGIEAENSGHEWQGLDAILARYPAGVAELWFARLYLLKPVVIASLSLFWLLSGIIALIRFNASAAHLQGVGLSHALAALLTALTSLVDIALGALVLVRRHAPIALKGMILLSLAYLATATLTAPSLWLDPLGPLVKVLPSLALTFCALAILDER